MAGGASFDHDCSGGGEAALLSIGGSKPTVNEEQLAVKHQRTLGVLGTSLHQIVNWHGGDRPQQAATGRRHASWSQKVDG